ncbi:MAG: translation initiation factor 2 [Pseudomonadota bacterium]
MKPIVIACAALMLSGCATITRGTSNDIVINYEPANAKVVTSFGHECEQSPCEFEIKRKEEFSITATAPGFQKETVDVKTRIAKSGAAGFAGNALLGGIIGAGVDAANGATLEHYPNPVDIKLVPEGQERPETTPGETDVPVS